MWCWLRYRLSGQARGRGAGLRDIYDSPGGVFPCIVMCDNKLHGKGSNAGKGMYGIQES